MTCMSMMEVTVMHVIDMTRMLDRRMSAICAVRMIGMTAMQHLVSVSSAGTQGPRAKGKCNASHPPCPFCYEECALTTCQASLSRNMS